MKATERAVVESIQVRQLVGSDGRVATSGKDQTTAYELDVISNVAHGCSCLAGLNDDPVCKHRASFYLLIGAIDLDPEPGPSAPPFLIDCQNCRGCGVHYSCELERAGLLYPTCAVCGGSGVESAA